jgi:hypothetical protein
VRELNSDPDRINWVIAENTPEDAPVQDKLANDGRFNIVPGVSPMPRVTEQHTMALSKALSAVRTRFVLILDPDFYIIRREWVDLLITHMQTESLCFMGSTWNPKYSEKYRYFPTLHCFLADTSRISLEDLDFRPIPLGVETAGDPGTNNEHKPHSAATKWGQFLGRFPAMKRRLRIHLDTGGRLYYEYAGSEDHSYQCLTPVFREAAEDLRRMSWRGKCIELILPDELCRFPKNRESYRMTGFAEEGLWEPVPPQWDEFYWKNDAFGFHVRRNAKKGDRNELAEIEVLKNRLDMFIG